MEKKFRVSSKNLLLRYFMDKMCPTNQGQLEELKSTIMQKLATSYQVQDYLFVRSFSSKEVFVYLQLSKTSKKLDTSNSAFFDLNAFSLKCIFQGLEKGFQTFCKLALPLLESKDDFIYLSSSEILVEKLKAALQDETNKLQKGTFEGNIEHFFSMNTEDYESTNYSSIPSKSSSLSSATERFYREKIQRLEEENLHTRSFYEGEQVKMRADFEEKIHSYDEKILTLERKMVEMFSFMNDKIQILEEENRLLRSSKS